MGAGPPRGLGHAIRERAARDMKRVRKGDAEGEKRREKHIKAHAFRICAFLTLVFEFVTAAAATQVVRATI